VTCFSPCGLTTRKSRWNLRP